MGKMKLTVLAVVSILLLYSELAFSKKTQRDKTPAAKAKPENDPPEKTQPDDPDSKTKPSSAPSWLPAPVASVFDTVWSGLKSAFNYILEFLQKGWSALLSLLSPVLGKIPGFPGKPGGAPSQPPSGNPPPGNPPPGKPSLDGGKLFICSFNVQIFGESKSEKKDVMDILGKIFRRYDLCLLMELRSKTDKPIEDLLAKINEGTDKYEMVLSEKLGKSVSTERYVFFYKKDKIKVSETYQYPDMKSFQRPPYFAKFDASSSAVKTFFIGGIHTEPDHADDEIGLLGVTFDSAAKKFGIEDGIIMGDYNAGCSYFNKGQREKNKFKNDPRFVWLIGDDANTNVGASGACAYDRVVANKALATKISNARVFYYDKEGIDVGKTEVKHVSDHYPVEFTLG